MGNLMAFYQKDESDDEISDEDEFLPAVSTKDMSHSTGMDSSSFSADALYTNPPKFHYPVSGFRLTVEDLLDIDRELDLEEKVSVVYLLYDDAKLAMKILLLLQNGAAINILREWQKSENNDSWNTKLLEALSIIQNFKLLQKYGYKMEEVHHRFLPLNTSTSIEIDLTKKKLYHLINNFKREELKTLLDHVKKDFVSKNLNFKVFTGNVLEIYLLHWNVINYITSSNFINLAKIFKQLDMLEMHDYLISIGGPHNSVSIPRTSRHTDATDLDDIPEFPLSRSMSTASSVNNQGRLRNDSYCSYPMNDVTPGLCLIINQERFYTEPDPSLRYLLPDIGILETRDGTNFDRERIKNTMEQFGFEPYIRNNLDHVDILKAVEKIVHKVKEEDSSLFIYILSHGVQGKVYGANSIPVEVSQIQKIMCETNIKNLTGKAKVLIIQACQGTVCQEVVAVEDDIRMDGPTVSHRPIPKSADMLVFWATVPGFSAVRDRNSGTWFIQSLCDKLKEKSSQFHFEDICTMIIKDVINRRWGTRAMVPIKESTLSASLFLPQIK